MTPGRFRQMRFALVNHSYKQFLDWLYQATPGLDRQTFAEQSSAYYQTLFASSDFYLHGLRSLGHEAHEFMVNNTAAQAAWLRENRGSIAAAKRGVAADAWPSWVRSLRDLFAKEPIAGSRTQHTSSSSSFDILLEQVRVMRPDILYNQSVFAFDDDQLRALKAHVGRIVGEHAAMPLPETIDYRLYDLIVSSFPPTIHWLRGRGARAELNRLAFDARVATAIPERTRDLPVTFVGSFLAVHNSRLELIEQVAAAFPAIAVHGSVTEIAASSPLQRRVGPPLWGRDMYGLLRRSVITLNHHGDVPPYANNMRLFEATGMGCLLVTDYKDNLHEMFEPEREVVTYRDPAECIDKVRFYLDERNVAARERIMAAGQARTLNEHTYQACMRRLVDLIRTL
jgi:spore maturation protein CgeB